MTPVVSDQKPEAVIRNKDEGINGRLWTLVCFELLRWTVSRDARSTVIDTGINVNRLFSTERLSTVLLQKGNVIGIKETKGVLDVVDIEP